VRRLGVVAWVEKRERGTLQCPAPGSPPARGLRWVAALLLFCIGLVHANEPFESEIAAFDAQPAQPGAVVFIGSSSIRLWNTLATDFPDVPVLNRGFGGSELRHATYSAERILARHAPRAVVLYSGDNDLAAGRTPQQVAADFAAFVDTVQALPTHPRIAVIAIKPCARGAAARATRGQRGPGARRAGTSECRFHRRLLAHAGRRRCAAPRTVRRRRPAHGARRLRALAARNRPFPAGSALNPRVAA
jgi:hypothetical protein